MSAPPAWLQLFVDAGEQPERIEAALAELQPLAITLQDAADNPVYEPAPLATPLWPSVQLCALLPGDTDTAAARRTLNRALAPEGLPAHRFEPLADRDWERAWLDDFGPMRFGQRLWIVPATAAQAPHKIPDDAITIRLDPGLAFGTGTHATTALCLQWLDAHPPRAQAVVDYGCGSGVLALAAARLGAASVLATDNDPQALWATTQNAQNNALDPLIRCHAPEELPLSPVDVVLANILAGPLLELRPRLTALVRPGGHLVLSGMLAAQAERVAEAYAADFVLDEPVIADGWARLSGRRRHPDAG